LDGEAANKVLQMQIETVKALSAWSSATPPENLDPALASEVAGVVDGWIGDNDYGSGQPGKCRDLLARVGANLRPRSS
jgi:hypothetical protein